MDTAASSVSPLQCHIGDKSVSMLRPLVPASLLLASVAPHCWKPNINPFTGPPDTERLEGDTGEWGRVGDVVFTLSTVYSPQSASPGSQCSPPGATVPRWSS